MVVVPVFLSGVSHAAAQGMSRLGRLDAWLDAGGGRVEQPNRASERAGVLDMGATLAGRTLSLSGQLAATLAGDSTGAGHGALIASIAPPAIARIRARTDVGGSITTFGLPSRDRGKNGSWSLRQSLQWSYGGIFGTVATSRTQRPAPFRRGDGAFEHFRATSVDAGIWGGYRWLSASLLQQRTLSDDYPLAESTGFGLTRPSASYDFRDLVLTTGFALSRLELEGAFARRAAGSATRGQARASLVSVRVQVTRSLSLTISHGTSLADPLRGTPQATMTSAGVRVHIGSAGGRIAASSDAATLEIRPGGGAELTVRVRAASDALVELATSYGEWAPSPMTREKGRFIARVTLPSGTHHVAVRINGGEWWAPAGLARVKDGLGGTAGVVVVP